MIFYYDDEYRNTGDSIREHDKREIILIKRAAAEGLMWHVFAVAFRNSECFSFFSTVIITIFIRPFGGTYVD